MPWNNQNPPSQDVILYFSLNLRDAAASLEIDRLATPSMVGDIREYRLTIGDLFESREVRRTTNLEELVRLANKLASATTQSEAKRFLMPYLPVLED